MSFAKKEDDDFFFFFVKGEFLSYTKEEQRQIVSEKIILVKTSDFAENCNKLLAVFRAVF